MSTPSLFHPSNMTSGGFLDDRDVTIVAAMVGTLKDTRFTEGEDSTFLIPTFRPDGEDEDADHKEYYRIGDLAKVLPSPDNQRAVFADGAKLNKGTKAGLFLASLHACGLPAEKFPADNNVGFLVGLRMHVNQTQMQVREGGKNSAKFKKKDGADPPQVLLCTKLLDGAAPKVAAGTAGKAKAAVPSSSPTAGGSTPAVGTSSADDPELAATVMVCEVLKEKGQTDKKLLATEAMKRIQGPVRNKVFGIIGKADFLKGGPWNYDEGSGALTKNEGTDGFLQAQQG
jgi:hypothetical protein